MVSVNRSGFYPLDLGFCGTAGFLCILLPFDDSAIEKPVARNPVIFILLLFRTNSAFYIVADTSHASDALHVQYCK